MTFTVREARSDAEWTDALAVLHGVYAGEAFSTWERVQGTQRRDLLEHEGAFLVAVDGSGTVLGATILLHPGSALHQVATGHEREFRMLAVARSARGNGVGEALVRACIERSIAEGGSALVLWTQPSMRAAQRLYERLGFLREPDRDQPDPRGFQRLVYRAPLRSA